MQWAHPQWFWILVPAVPLLVWYHLRSLSDFPPAQKTFSLLIRIALLVLLVAAICGPTLMRSTKKQMIIFAVDRSQSVDEAASAKADEFIAKATEAAKSSEAEVKFLAFDRDPHRILDTWPPEESTDGDPQDNVRQSELSDSDDGTDDGEQNSDGESPVAESPVDESSKTSEAESTTDESNADQASEQDDPSLARLGSRRRK